MGKVAAREPVTTSVGEINDEVAVGEDLGFQRTWWRFERGVWLFFVLVIIADLAGVFGRGPVANAQLKSADGALMVTYERIERTGTPSMMTITLGAAASRDGYAHLHVSDSVVHHLGALRIIPQPATTSLGGGGLTYTFSTTDPPAVVRFELQPDGPGINDFSIDVPGLASVNGKILVMP